MIRRTLYVGGIKNPPYTIKLSRRPTIKCIVALYLFTILLKYAGRSISIFPRDMYTKNSRRCKWLWSQPMKKGKKVVEPK